MKYVWPVLLVIFRTLYFAYCLWCFLFPVAVVCLVVALTRSESPMAYHLQTYGWLVPWVFAAFATLLLGVIWLRRQKDDPNPFQSAFMAWFGTLRWFWNVKPAPRVALGLPSGPLVENPGGYRIGGADMRNILGKLQPGDILLRGYRGYVDGALIRRSSRCIEKGFSPGWFTHAALYVGTLDSEDRKRVPERFRDDLHYFQEGPQRVVHSMSMGVHTEDILTFCRCDYLVVLRIKPSIGRMERQAAPRFRGRKSLDIHLPSDDLCSALEADLASGKPVDHDAAIAAAKQSALEKIGEKYDFDCSDTKRFHRFSCAELVYFCYRGIRTALDLSPQLHALYPFGSWGKKFGILKRVTLTPDDYYDLVAQGTMECVWEDNVSAEMHRKVAATP